MFITVADFAIGNQVATLSSLSRSGLGLGSVRDTCFQNLQTIQQLLRQFLLLIPRGRDVPQRPWATDQSIDLLTRQPVAGLEGKMATLVMAFTHHKSQRERTVCNQGLSCLSGQIKS